MLEKQQVRKAVATALREFGWEYGGDDFYEADKILTDSNGKRVVVLQPDGAILLETSDGGSYRITVEPLEGGVKDA